MSSIICTDTIHIMCTITLVYNAAVAKMYKVVVMLVEK